MPWIRRGGTAYVTSLPSSPVDGQEVYYAADATNGVIWHLRYRSGSSSSYKWEYVGGGQIGFWATDASPPSITSTSYAAIGSNSVTLPLAGDYELTWGAWVVASSTNSTTLRSVLLKPGSSAPGTDGAQALHCSAQDTNAYPNVTKVAQFTGFSASSTVKVYGRHNTAGTLTTLFYWLYLAAVPIRVG